MKTLITYSSKTNNTKKMAEAIYKKLKEFYDCDLEEISQDLDLDLYENILVGGYNDKAVLDKTSLKFIEKLAGKNIGLFATAGAGPETDQGKDFTSYMEGLLKDKNSLGVYLLPGRVSDKLKKAIEISPAGLIAFIRKDLRQNLSSKEVKQSLLDFIDKSRNASEKELEDAGLYFLKNFDKKFN